MNELYRPGAFIGDGGTASVIKFEKATGLRLGRNGGTHEQKGRDRLPDLHLRVQLFSLAPCGIALNFLIIVKGQPRLSSQLLKVNYFLAIATLLTTFQHSFTTLLERNPDSFCRALCRESTFVKHFLLSFLRLDIFSFILYDFLL